jgi:hypothetical protein
LEGILARRQSTSSQRRRARPRRGSPWPSVARVSADVLAGRPRCSRAVV